MLKKTHYATFKYEIIIELQKTVEGIFKSELEKFKAKLEKTLQLQLFQEAIHYVKNNFNH